MLQMGVNVSVLVYPVLINDQYQYSALVRKES